MTTWENRLTFEVSSADPDSVSPVWVNLTSRVRDNLQPVTLQIGRQNDLNQAEPARIDLLLDNSDNALTYGNTASPYTWWGPGRKCRLRELVNGVTTTRFTGFLQVPTESLITAGIEQRVSITAMDRLGRLASGEPFVSALGAYILRTSDLAAYWPLTDAAAPYGGLGPISTPVTLSASGGPGGAVASPRAGNAPPGGEFSGLRLVTGKNASNVVTSGYAVVTPALSLPIGANDAVTVVFWAAVTGTTTTFSPQPFMGAMNVGAVVIDLKRDPTAETWSLIATGPMTGTVTVNSPGAGTLFPIGVRFVSAPSALMELWIGGQRASVVPVGAAPGVSNVIPPFWASNLDYDLSQAQIYIGQNYSYADFQAQITQGYTPLERQTTGDRIRTIAAYAGIPAAELTQVDKGQSVMQPARLAGKDPLTAMRDAERTEQGLLYADGDGNLVFKDRSSLYNI